MKQFDRELGAIEGGDISPRKMNHPNRELSLFEKLKLDRVIRVAGYVGVMAAALMAAGVNAESASTDSYGSGTVRVSHPLEDVGVTSDLIWVTDRQAAIQAAQEIAATGANTVRIFEPYSPGQADIKNDKLRLCNAAEAARESNLTLEISFMGHHGDKVSFVPDSASSVTRFLDTVNTILWNLAGPNANMPNTDGSPPCVEQPLGKLIIEEFNEVNSATFNANHDQAKKYAYLVSRAGPALAKDADNINQARETASPSSQGTASDRQFTLVRVAGGLAAGNHNPVGFLRSFDQDLKSLGVTTVPFDVLAVHPYPANLTSNPAAVETAIYQPLKSELDAAWGKDKNVPIFYDEVGVNAISTAKRFLYGPKSLKATAVSEGTQAEYYHDAFKVASQEEGVVGVLTFQGQDVSNDGWPSGIVNPDDSHKGSWNSVTRTFHEALDGTLGN